MATASKDAVGQYYKTQGVYNYSNAPSNISLPHTYH
jgi:hypothetical protein